MNWEKLKPVHYFKEPVTYFYSSSIFDTKEYDALYENQNNFNLTLESTANKSNPRHPLQLPSSPTPKSKKIFEPR